ncbi:MAG: hypothetical protein ABIS03_11280 [Gemmatimonadaceae bacterium]
MSIIGRLLPSSASRLRELIQASGETWAIFDGEARMKVSIEYCTV